MRIILNFWWIEVITELKQKNGAIKWKHEIKHGVETLQQHQRRAGVWIKFFKGPFIIYACIDSTMMWWNQRWIVPALFQVLMHASLVKNWNNGEKFLKFLSALCYTLRRVPDTRDDLLIVLAKENWKEGKDTELLCSFLLPKPGKDCCLPLSEQLNSETSTLS